MPQVIACPNCEKKLAVKDELKGRTLICPQCKGRFTVPADDPQPAAEEFDLAADDSPASGGAEMDFLDNLGPAPGPAAKTATKPAAPVRPTAASATAAARPAAAPRAAAPKAAATATGAATSAAPAASAASRAAASRAKKKNDQMMMIYIGGGIAAVVVVLIIIVAIVSSKGGSSGKTKDENIKFGMTEKQRKKLYFDMIKAVDDYGSDNQYGDCRREWKELGGKYKLTDSQIVEVMEEGLRNDNWPQPMIVANMEQKQKTNRHDWVRTRNETKRDPVMSR